jgi:hypothetical protein
MTREEFIKNFYKSEDACIIKYENDFIPADIRVTLALIGSIYDLQQQISELQDKLEEKYAEDSCPQCGSKVGDRCKMSCDEKWRDK